MGNEKNWKGWHFGHVGDTGAKARISFSTSTRRSSAALPLIAGIYDLPLALRARMFGMACQYSDSVGGFAGGIRGIGDFEGLLAQESI